MRDFSELIAPIALDAFYDHHWQRTPLLIRSGDRSLTNESLFNVSSIDDVIRRASANAGDVDFFAASRPLPQAEYSGPGRYLQFNRLLGHYAAGGTIHISNLQKYASSLDALCKSLQRHFVADVEADLWTTKRNSFPAYLHFDRHDIFVLQMQGKKRWRVYNQMSLAAGRPSSALEWSEVGDPILDVELLPGDLLYLPEFTPHAVTTLVQHAIHVGVGVHPVNWKALLDSVLERLLTEPCDLQKAVPTSMIDRQSDAASLKSALKAAIVGSLDKVDFGEVQKSLFDRFVANVTAPADCHFSAQVLQAVELTLSTLVGRRPDVVGRAFVDPQQRACVSYSGGGKVVGPPAILPALEYILSADTCFCANDLPGGLDADSCLQLLRHLIDTGLCTVVKLPLTRDGTSLGLAQQLDDTASLSLGSLSKA